MGQLPCCLCGCGERVKEYRHKYASQACVPRSIRADNCRRGRRTWAYRRRALTFREEYARCFDGVRVATKETILSFGQALYDKGYAAGQHKRLRAEKAAA